MSGMDYYFYTCVHVFVCVCSHVFSCVYMCLYMIGGQGTIPVVVHPVLSVFLKDNLSLAN